MILDYTPSAFLNQRVRDTRGWRRNIQRCLDEQDTRLVLVSRGDLGALLNILADMDGGE